MTNRVGCVAGHARTLHDEPSLKKIPIRAKEKAPLVGGAVSVLNCGD
jgi:hypothetical protein